MLRTNLATRPFYNDRAVHVVIGVAAAVVLAITALNVVQIVTLSRHNTELSSRGDSDRAEAERLTREAARIRRTINKDELALVVGAAQEANSLIDQRTFSWTEFFNKIESTLPPDVMLSSVRPSVKDGTTRVTMVVLGRRADGVDEFMEKLEATGAFESIVPAGGDRTEAGLYRAVIESVYTSSEDDAETEEPKSEKKSAGQTPAPASPPSAATSGRKPPARGGRQ